MKWSKPLPATNCELKEEWNCYYIKATVLKTADIMENFILYEELGSGSRSVVYKGRRKGSLNYVAIVCADKSKRPEITNHVRLSHDLSHGNIVAFYEWYETSNHLWVVTELCTGGSLEGVIGQDGCLSEEVVKEFGRDLVRGLRHIHQSGIIFSELTPAKILLDGPGVLKFSNFCQSKAEGETLEEFFSLLNTSEQSGGGGRGGRGGGDEKKNPDMNDRRKRIQGCPLYTAPEVLIGAETSCSSDLWALGCILYYMYTGKPPFYSDSYTELTDMILHKEPPAARQTGSSSPPSEEFQRLLKGLLIKDPEKRMGWSELLTQPFWTQILEEEDEEEVGEGSDVSDDSISPGYPHRQQEAIEPAPPERETDKTSTCTHRGGDRTRPCRAEQNCHTLYHKSFTLDSVSELKPKHVDKDNTEAFFLSRSNTSGRKSNGPDKDSNNF